MRPHADARQLTRRSPLRKFLAGAATALLVASGLVLGAVPGTVAPAQADSLQNGLITVTNAATKLSSVGHRVANTNAGFQHQLVSNQYGYAFYDGFQSLPNINKFGSPSTGTWAVNSAGTRATTQVVTAQSSGGTGTLGSPYVISTTADFRAGSTTQYTMTREDRYVIGQEHIQTTLTYTPRVAAWQNVGLRTWGDCYFSGSDSGYNRAGTDGVAGCYQTNTAASPAMLFIAGSPGASTYAGSFSSVESAAAGYAALPNACQSSFNCWSPGALRSSTDNGMAIGWQATGLALNVPIVRTYYTSYTADLRFANLQPSVTSSTSSTKTGNLLDVTITLANAGPNTATGPSSTFVLPAGLTFDSWVTLPPGVTWNATTGVFSYPDIASGAQSVVVMKVRAATAGTKVAAVTNAASGAIDTSVCAADAPSGCGTSATITVTDPVFDAARTTLTAAPASVLADGTTTSTLTASFFDTDGDPFTISSGIAFTRTGVGHTLGTVTYSGNKATATVTSANVGAVTAQTTRAGTNTGPTATVTFTAGPPTGASTFAVDPASVTANGTATVPVTVTARDAFGHVLPGIGSQIALTLGDGSAQTAGKVIVSAFTETTAGSGVYNATITSTQSGAFPATLTIGGVAATGEAGKTTATFTPGAFSASTSSYTVGATAAAVGTGTVPITAVIRDANGNGITGAAASLSSVLPAGVTLSTWMDAGNGTYTATLSSTSAGAKTIPLRFSTTDLTATGGANIATFTAGALSTTNSTFWVEGLADLSTSDADVSKTRDIVHVELRDAFNNPISGATIAPSATGTAAAGVSFGPFTETGTSGNYVAWVTSTKTGQLASFISANGTSITPRTVNTVAQNTSYFAGGDPDWSQSTFDVSTGDKVVGLGAANEHTLTVTIRDIHGNVTTKGVNDQWYWAGGATDDSGKASGFTMYGDEPNGEAFGEDIEPLAGMTGTSVDGSDTSFTRQFVSVLAGDKTFTLDVHVTNTNGDDLGVVGSLTKVANDVAPWVAAAPSAAASTVPELSGTRVADGTSAFDLTINLTDEYGNPIIGYDVTKLAATAGDGSVTSFVDNGDGTYTARITSTTAGDKPVSVTIDGATVADNDGQTATFVAGALSVGNSSYTVSTGSQSVEGGSHTLTVRLRDAQGNPLPFSRVGEVTVPQIAGLTITGLTATANPGEFRANITATASGTFPIMVELTSDPSQKLSIAAGGNRDAVFSAGAISAVNSRFEVTSGAVDVDGGSHAVTIELKDANGNLISGVAASAFTLSVAPTSGVTIGAVSAVAGQTGTYTAQVTSTSIGGKTIDVTVSGANLDAKDAAGDPANDVAAFTTDTVSAANSEFWVEPGPVTVGQSVTVHAILRDAFDNPVSGISTGLSGASDGPGTVGSFATTGADGSTTATFSSTKAGTETVTVSFGGTHITTVTTGEGDNATFTVGAVDPSLSTIEPIAGSKAADGTDAHTITVKLVDQYGNPVTGQAGQLSSTATGGGNTFGTWTESPAGSGTYVITLTSTEAGTKDVGVAFGGTPIDDGATQSAAFVAGAIDASRSSVVLTPAGPLTVSQSAGYTIVVTLRDANDNVITTVPDTDIDAAIDAAQTLGLGAISDFALDGTTYTATVTSTKSGSFPLTVTASGVELTADPSDLIAVFTAGAVDPTQSGTAVAPITGTAVANGTDTHTVTVTLVDEFGNPVTGLADDLTPSTTGAGSFAPEGFTEVSPGVYTTTITSTEAGDNPITVDFDGEDLPGSGEVVATFVAGPVDLTNPGSTFTVSDTAIPVTVTEASGATITVTLLDANNNPVEDSAVDLSKLIAAASDLGLGQPFGFVKVSKGVFAAQLTSSINGAKTVTVALDGQPIMKGANDIATFTTGTPSAANSVVNAPTGGAVADGSDTNTVSITLKDEFGNVITGLANPSTLLGGSADGNGSGTFGAFVEDPENPGTYIAPVTSTVAGDIPVHITVDGDVVATGDGQVATFVAGDVDPSRSTITAPTGTRTADGTDAFIIEVKLVDANGNAVSGLAGDLSGTALDLGNGEFATFTEDPDEPGTYTATLTSTIAGTKTLEVSVGGTALGNSGEVTAAFIAGDVSIADGTSSFTVTTGSKVVATDPHIVTITLKDADGNFVPDKTAELSGTVDGMAVLGTISQSATPGIYTAEITSTASGVKNVTITYGASTAIPVGANGTATFSAGAPDMTQAGTKIDPMSGTRVADGTDAHTLTVTLVDEFGNPVTGLTAADFDAAAGDATVGSFTETSPGVYTWQVTSTTAGAKDVEVSVNGVNVTNGADVVATFVAGDVDLTAPGTAYSVTDTNAVAGVDAHTVTVTLVDAQSNPVPGQAGSLTAASAQALTGGSITSFTESATTPGTYTATITSQLAGVKAITVAFGDPGEAVTADGNAQARFIAGAVDLSNTGSTVGTITGTHVADGVDAAQIVVTLVDQFGNPVPGAAALLTGDAGALGTGEFTAFAEDPATPGRYVATVTSTQVGDKTVHVEFDGTPLPNGNDQTLTFIAGTVDLTNSGSEYAVSSGDVVVDGTHLITVHLADAEGNPVPGKAGDLEAVTTDDLGDGTISPFTATAVAGEYTATVSSTVIGGKTITVTYAGDPVDARGANTVAAFTAAGVDPTNDASGYEVTTGDKVVSNASTDATKQHTITVTLADEFGNPVAGADPATLSATADTGVAATISAFTATGVAGEFSATVTSTKSGPNTITVLWGGTAVNAGDNIVANFIAGAVDFTQPGTGVQQPSGDKVANGTDAHTITVTLVDEFGNPVPGVADELSGSTVDNGDGTFTVFTEDPANPGTYTAEVTSTKSGDKPITVTFGDDATELPGSGTVTASFIAGPVDPTNAGSAIVPITSTKIADGVEQHVITVTLVDAEGNPAPGQAAALTLDVAGLGDLGDGVTTVFVEDPDNPGTYTATITSTVMGDKPVTVAFNGTDLAGSGDVVATFVAGAVDITADGTGFAVTTGDQVVGTTPHVVTVTLVDAQGNRVTGQAAALSAAPSATLGTGVITAFVETATVGEYTANIPSTSAGDKTITVTHSGAGLALTDGGNDVASFVAADPDVTQSGTKVNPLTGTRVADGTDAYTLTVTLVDEFGNPVPGAADLLSGSAGDLGDGTFTTFTEDPDNPGTYTATITSTRSGDKPVVVEVDGVQITNGSDTVASFVPGPVDLSNTDATYFTVSTGSQVVGTGSHTVTVTLADADGNPVSSLAAELTAATADDLGSGLITGFTETATPGTYTATITSTKSLGKTVTVSFGPAATAEEISVQDGGNDVATFHAGAVDFTQPGTGVQQPSGDKVANGTDAHTITVTLVDEFGNPVPGVADELSGSTVDNGDGTFTVFTEDPANPGTYTAEVTSTKSGDKPITVTFGDDATELPGSGDVTASFVAGPIDYTHPGTTIEQITGDKVADGTDEHTVRVTLVDADGNPVTGQAGNLTGSTPGDLGDGGFGPWVEVAPGVYEAPLTSTVSGDKPITVQVGSGPDSPEVPGSGDVSASFVAGDPVTDGTNTTTRFTVTTGSQVVGTGVHTVTVTLGDANDNPVPGKASMIAAATVDDLGGRVISTFTETSTPGTYTATITSTRSGEKTITAELDGAGAITLQDAGNDVATFHAGAVDFTNPGTGVQQPSGDKTANGTDAHTITVTLVDEFGNPVPGVADELSGSTVDNGDGTFTVFTEDPANPGTYTAEVTSTKSGDKPITVTFGDDATELPGSGDVTASFIAGPVDPTNPGTTYQVSGGDVVVGGTHLVTVTLVDADGNPAPGHAAVLAAATADALGTGVISAFTETSTPGTYTATIGSTVVGGKNVTATFGTDAIAAGGNTVASFTQSGTDLSNPRTVYTVTAGDEIAGVGSHTVTVNLFDEFDNAVVGQAAALSAQAESSVFGAFTEVADGVYTATITSEVAGGHVVTVLFGGDPVTVGENDTASFIAGSVDWSDTASRYTVSTGDQTVGTGAHTVTVRAADTFGNPTTIDAADLSAATTAALGNGTITAFVERPRTAAASAFLMVRAVPDPAAPVEYVATITSTVSGLKPITVAGVSGIDNLAASFVAGAIDFTNPGTGIQPVEGTKTADGEDAHIITVTLVDEFGNPVPGMADLLNGTTTDNGDGTFTRFVEDPENPGTYIAEVTSTKSGDKPITVTVGDTVLGPEDTVASFEPGPAANVIITPGEPQWNGTEWITPITIVVTDKFGNVIHDELPLDLHSDNGTFDAPVFDPETGTYTTTFRSPDGGPSTVTVSLGDTVLGQITVDVPPAPVTPVPVPTVPLPLTGTSVPMVALVAGLVLAAAGIWWIVVARRRSRRP